MTEELQIITVDGGTHVVSVGVQGPPGATGATGSTGAAGPGVAAGGSTGQYLKKASGTDYDTTWDTVSVSPGGSAKEIQFNSAGAFGGATGFEYQSASSPNVLVQAQNAAHVPLTLKGFALQSANLLEAQDSAGTVLTKIDGAGKFGVNMGAVALGYDFHLVGSFGLTATPAGSAILSFTSAGSIQGSANVGHYLNGGLLVKSNGTSVMDSGYSTFSTSIFAYSASTVPLVVKAAASQTANLQQWQDSAGTALSYITSAGYLVMPGITFSDGGQGAGNGLGLTSGSHAFITVPSGYGCYLSGNYGFYPNYNSANFGVTINNNLTSASAPKTTPAVIPLRIIANASQTANLTEWQNSSGGLLASVATTPSFTVGNPGTTRYLRATINSLNFYEWNGTQLFAFNLNDGGTGPRIDAQAGGFFQVTSHQYVTGVLKVGSTIGFSDNAKLHVTTTDAAGIGIIVKASASQTANLTEWQNSSGTALASVNSAGKWIGNQDVIAWNSTTSMATIGYTGPSGEGGIAFGASSDAKMYRSGTRTVQLGARFTAAVLNAADVPLVAKGYTSQTANLQEWQDSAGTALCWVKNNGEFYNAGTYLWYNTLRGINNKIVIRDIVGYINLSSDSKLQWDSTTGWSTPDVAITRSAAGILKVTNASSGDGSLIVGAYSSSTVALTVKAAASQTANLTEWQNSSGTVLGYVNSSAMAKLDGLGVGTANPITGCLSTSRIYSDDYRGYLSAAVTFTGMNVIHTPGSAAGVPLTLKGFSSQTANLQEWQDSSATTLSSIDKNGAWVPPSMADGTAANNTVYYSTTAGKLVYKDAGGTVNNLY